MKQVSPDEVHDLIVKLYSGPLVARGLDGQQLPADYDLLSEGVIDSLGFIELISALETDLGLEIDFEDMNPEELTVVGPFCEYVARKSAGTQ